MNRKLLAVIVSGALAAPMAAQVHADEMSVEPHSHPATYEHEHEMDDGMMAPVHLHEHQAHPPAEHPHAELHGHPDVAVYGSLRYGVMMVDKDVTGSGAEWTIGSNHGSRFGIMGSSPAGAGLTAGFHIERNLNDGLTPRHHNVSLSGGFGKATFGQQSSPYYGASTWDGSNHLGGATDVALRRQGVSYASALNGPFEFSLFASDHTGADKGDSGADHLEAAGSFSAGPVSLTAGYMEQADKGERFAGTVSGTAANITLVVGYEDATDVTCTSAAAEMVTHTAAGMAVTHGVTPEKDAVMCDEERYGFNLSYLFGAGPGGGNAFVQFGDRDSEVDKNDTDYWVFGYSYYASESVTVNIAHRIQNAYDKMEGGEVEANTSVVSLKVDF